MSAILSGLVTTFKGIAAAKALVDQFVELWLTYQTNQIGQEYDDKKAERDALIFALKNSPDDAVRKDCARKLYRLGV